MKINGYIYSELKFVVGASVLEDWFETECTDQATNSFSHTDIPTDAVYFIFVAW